MSNIKKKCMNLWVVGDRLKDFFMNKNIISVSELELLIESELGRNEGIKFVINFGQGVNENVFKHLKERAEHLGLTDYIQINIPDFYIRSNSHLTHKKKTENIMISEPTQCDSKNYLSALMLRDNCAEMSDHLTSQHIQSMVLVEAARQMVIAVTEKYFILESHKGRLNFITHNMDTTFSQYVFPLPVSIRYQIIELKMGKNNNLTSKALISFVQNAHVAVEIEFKFSVLDSNYIKEQEAEMAVQCIESQFRNVVIDFPLGSCNAVL